MRACLSTSISCLFRAMATLMAFIFIITSVAVLVLFFARLQLLNPDFYARTLESQDLYAQIPRLIADQLIYSTTYNPCIDHPELCEGEGPAVEGEGGPPDYIKNLKAEDLEAIFTDLLPPAWIQEQVEITLKQLFAYLNGDVNRFEIRIPMQELKSRLKGEAGLETILKFLRSQEPCTEADLASLAQLDLSGGPQAIPICAPPEDMVERYRPTILSMLNDAVLRIPDILKITDLDGPENTSDEPPLEPLRKVIAAARLGALYGLLLVIGLLLLIALFAVRSFKGWLRWWGIPVFIAGTLGFAAAFLSFAAVRWLMSTSFQPGGVYLSAISPSLQEMLLEMIGYGSRALLLPMAVTAALMLLGGLGMWVGSYFIPEE